MKSPFQQQDTSDDPFAFAFKPQNFQETVQKAQSTLENPFFNYAASNIGKKIVGFGERYDSFINQLFSSKYRFYFDVDNNYVVKKFTMTIAPFIYRGDWNNNQSQGEDQFAIISPTENVHAPDLYLPIMSMITFVLLRCLSIGLAQIEVNGKQSINTSGFHPGLIGSGLWKCVVFSVMEVLLVKIVFCFMDGNRVPTFDLISHLNYRYCSLCALVIFDILFDGYFYYIQLTYILGCQALFVYKTLQRYSSLQNQSALGISFIWVEYNITTVVDVANLVMVVIVFWIVILIQIVFYMQKVGKLQFKRQVDKVKQQEDSDKRKFSEIKKVDEAQDPEYTDVFQKENETLKRAQIAPEELITLTQGKTQAEIQYDLVRLKRLGQKIEKKMDLTYRQKIEKFNKNIQKMPEHYDIPKVGPG